MKLLIEVGRFIVTALAVALAVPLSLVVFPLFSAGGFSTSAFFGIGAVTFVFSLAGGLVFGLPALWFARQNHWDQSKWKLAIYGGFIGLLAGLITNALFWQGNFELVMPSLFPFGMFGALGGIVAGLVWFLLHKNDRLIANDA
ncbi:hypothetical protein [Qipengyuania psychrotolerans]|uniref:Uncharacterized protein n=1 Tax=Qipengyuania psychrotolerans TaxID=2867238 RepID=A0ABX8ZH00_9SPHN|nr:hypothetical protein [Qipengyuania psychrotolerans]QZD88268.1 hypothetical protein K3166_06280 [Qipengyuania psychrotolerans]